MCNNHVKRIIYNFERQFLSKSKFKMYFLVYFTNYLDVESTPTHVDQLVTVAAMFGLNCTRIKWTYLNNVGNVADVKL